MSPTYIWSSKYLVPMLLVVVVVLVVTIIPSSTSCCAVVSRGRSSRGVMRIILSVFIYLFLLVLSCTGSLFLSCFVIAS